jgi:hypothetical protein
MMLYQEGRGIAPDQVRAEFHPSGFAMIKLGDTRASVFVNTTDEADALIAAACEAKRLLLAKRAPADWCQAYTGPDEELDMAVYCDRQAGHPGNHHGAARDGSEIAWPSEPASPEAADRLYDAIVNGTPVVVYADDDEPERPARPVIEVVHAETAPAVSE